MDEKEKIKYLNEMNKCRETGEEHDLDWNDITSWHHPCEGAVVYAVRCRTCNNYIPFKTVDDY